MFTETYPDLGHIDYLSETLPTTRSDHWWLGKLPVYTYHYTQIPFGREGDPISNPLKQPPSWETCYVIM